MEFVSFSRYQKFKLCPRFFELGYLLKPDELEDVVIQDTTDAMIGTYVQLLFETVINNKLFLRYSDTNCDIPPNETIGLTSDIMKLLLSELEYPKCKLEEITDFGIIKPTGKLFYSSKKLTEVKLIEYQDRIMDLFLDNFYKLSEQGLKWENCKCEVKVERQTEIFKLTGYVDFLFENDNEIIILDGKLNKNLYYATPEQLEFYVWGLGYENNPNVKIGFHNYLKQETRMWESNKAYLTPELIDGYIQELNNCKEHNYFQVKPYEQGEVKGHCKWCPVSHICVGTNKKLEDSDIVNTDSYDISDFI